MINPTREYFIKFEIPSEMNLIHVLDALTTEILKEMDFNEENAEQVNLAIIEAGTNAIKHGNKSNPGKMVNFQFHLDEDKLTVVVTDEGEGFDTNKPPNPFAPENFLKASGRGIYVIKLCMDEVIFNKSGSEVRMVKYNYNGNFHTESPSRAFSPTIQDNPCIF